MSVPAPRAPHDVRGGRIWQRYVAIGDSFTEGMSDPHPTAADTYVGWADRLAGHLAEQNTGGGNEFGYANLAVRGRLLDDIAGQQLEQCLAMQPDLVSIVGGGNDIMRPKVRLDDVADRLEAAVRRIRETGADVMMATMANPGNAGIMGRLTPQISWHVANVWGIAQRHECYVLDVWSMRVLRDPRMWSADRLHLSSEGHRRVAQQAAWTLGLPVDGDWLETLPALPRAGARQRLSENARWTRDHLGPWMHRRIKGTSSGDNRSPKRPALQPITMRALSSPTGEPTTAAGGSAPAAEQLEESS